MGNRGSSEVEEKSDNSGFASAKDKWNVSKMPQDIQDLYKANIKYSHDKSGHLTFYPSPFLSAEEITKTRKYATETKPETIAEVAAALSWVLSIDKIEAMYDYDAEIYSTISDMNGTTRIHGFLGAATTAWSYHYDLRIKPSHIWLMILQAVAKHVDQNAEQLRKQWVKHEGKKKLHLRRDDFVKGSKDNDWAGLISEFCDQIDKNTIDNTVPLLESDFTTTTLIEKVATKITIMDICKKYFEYGFSTLCGFPKITLEGTKDDWIKLHLKTETLLRKKVDSKWGKKWAKSLFPVLHRFIRAYDGDINAVFWNSMIKRDAWYGSGAYSWFSGWINVFFPFTDTLHPNQYCVPFTMDADYVKDGIKEAGRGFDISKAPNGIASADCTWQCLSTKYELAFAAGFMGFEFDKDATEISPVVGWFIGEKKETTEEKPE